MASFPPVRSVERAIQLLQTLNQRPISTLDILHRQTGLPKPSLVRLLQTLIGLGLVNHAPQHGAYYLTSGVCTLSSGYHSEPRIIEAAAPEADALTAKLKWPVAVAVPDANAVVIRYSTIGLSPLSLLHSSINMRLSLVSRALGRAYLAFCPKDEQQVLLALLAQSDQAEDQPARDSDAALAMLDAVRRQGFALRSPAVRPVSNTLALPIYEHGHVVATLGMTWFSSALTVPQACTRLLPALQAAVEKISFRLTALESSVPSSKPRKKMVRPV